MATNRYSDLDLSFEPHPLTGDVAIKYDAADIKQSLRNIVLTAHYERPFFGAFGGSVFSLLFENFDVHTLYTIEVLILDAIRNFEPRVDSVDVSASTDGSPQGINIEVTFTMANSDATNIIKIPLNERI
jgi:phage baseplate assembly protein W